MHHLFFYFFMTLCGTLFLAPTPSPANDESWPSTPIPRGLVTDAGLWTVTWGMENFWHQPAGVRNFPTTSLDMGVRSRLHGELVEKTYSERERAWRQFSDFSIAGLVTGSLATPMLMQKRSIQPLIKVSRAFALNNFACSLLKNAVHRARPKPALIPEVAQNGDNAKSFPSSHASNALVAATSMVLMTPESSAVFHATIYALGASIAIGRVMADRHFFTDIVVGGAIGAGITHWVFSRSDSDQEIAFTGNAIVVQTRF